MLGLPVGWVTVGPAPGGPVGHVSQEDGGFGGPRASA